MHFRNGRPQVFREGCFVFSFLIKKKKSYLSLLGPPVFELEHFTLGWLIVAWYLLTNKNINRMTECLMWKLIISYFHSGCIQFPSPQLCVYSLSLDSSVFVIQQHRVRSQKNNFIQPQFQFMSVFSSLLGNPNLSEFTGKIPDPYQRRLYCNFFR